MDTRTILATWAESPDAPADLPSAGGRYQPVDVDGTDAPVPFEVGRGGLGRVLTLRDKRLGRVVALKELHSGRGSQRFLREACITAQLEHPSIVPVYELGEREDGTLYYTMKYVRGRTLAEALGGCRTLEQRLSLLGHYADLCHAVAYAHSQGAVHRDLKPDNVMVGAFGETQVLDWGLVKIQDEEEGERWHPGSSGEGGTMAGSLLGTPSYMSPEQAWGQSDVDARADTWSLGVMLFELLTGQVPFTGRTTEQVLQQVRAAPVPPVRSLCPQAPADLAAVADKALSRDPEARYADASAMAAELEAFRSGARVLAYDYSAWELLRRFVAEHRTAVAVLAVSAVVLAVVAGLLYAQVVSERDVARSHLARSIASQASSERAAAEAARLSGDPLQARARVRRSLELADSPEARALWWSLNADPLVATRTLGSAIQDLSLSPSGRTVAVAPEGSSVYLLDAATLGLVQVLREAGDQLTGVELVSDEHLLTLDWSGAIRSWSLSTGQSTLVAQRPGDLMRLAASPDGRRVAAGNQDGLVFVWELAEPSEPLVLEGHEYAVWNMAFSADGARLVTTSSDSTARVWHLDTLDQPPVVLRGASGALNGVALHPDGRVATAGGDQLVRIWSSDGEVLQELGGHGAGMAILDWEADLVATADRDGTVGLWWESGEHRLLEGSEDALWALDLSADGTRLLTGGDDHVLRVWDTTAAAREEAAADHGHSAYIWDLRFSPDGAWVASAGADGTARIWDTGTGVERAVLRGHGEVLNDLAWSPTGELLATAGADGVVRLHDPASGRETGALSGHQDEVFGLDFSADGALLATASGDRRVRLWSLETQEVLASTEGRGRLVMDVDLSPSGRLAAAVDYGGNVLLYALPDLREVRALEGHTSTVWGVDFSADGRHLVTGSEDGSVRVWDVASGAELARLDLPERAYKVDLHPDGERVGIGAADKVDRVWRWTDGSVLELHGHREESISLRFSPTAELAASAGGDGTVRLWDLATGRPVWATAGLLSHPPRLYSHQGLQLPASGEATESRLDEAVLAGATLLQTWEGTTCLVNDEGQVELWARQAGAATQVAELAPIHQLVPLAGACLARSRDEAWLLDDQGLSLLGDEVSAVGRGAHGPLVASAQQLLLPGPGGPTTLPVERGLSALAQVGETVVLGFADGGVQLRPIQGPSIHLVDTPAAAVLSLLPGPEGTVVVGSANGQVGLWSTRDGSPLRRARLHGPVLHLLLEGQVLVAATELGDSLAWDLQGLTAERCQVLSEVWSRVPLSWEHGAAEVAGPPAEHVCAR